jgi:hypothetical protein
MPEASEIDRQAIENSRNAQSYDDSRLAIRDYHPMEGKTT